MFSHSEFFSIVLFVVFEQRELNNLRSAFSFGR